MIADQEQAVLTHLLHDQRIFDIRALTQLQPLRSLAHNLFRSHGEPDEVEGELMGVFVLCPGTTQLTRLRLATNYHDCDYLSTTTAIERETTHRSDSCHYNLHARNRVRSKIERGELDPCSPRQYRSVQEFVGAEASRSRKVCYIARITACSSIEKK